MEPLRARKGAGLLHEGRGAAGVHGPPGPGAVCSVEPAAGAARVAGSAAPALQFFGAPPVPSPM